MEETEKDTGREETRYTLQCIISIQNIGVRFKGVQEIKLSPL